MSLPPDTLHNPVQDVPSIELNQFPTQPGMQLEYPIADDPRQKSLSQVQDAPPSYNQVNPLPLPPVAQQQTSANIAIVQQQPTVGVNPTNGGTHTSDKMYIMSVVLTTCFVFCFCWHLFVCSIPALIFSIFAKRAWQRGDDAATKKFVRLSLGFNVAAIVFWIVTMSVPIIYFIVILGIIVRFLIGFD